MQNSFPFEKIVPEMIKVIRRKSSQAQISRRLGHNSNQIHRWETLSSQINWKDFCELCKVQKFPLKEALFHQLKYQGSSDDAAQLITHLIGHSSVKEFCAAVQFKPSLVSKWRSGLVVPRLVQVLMIIERLHGVCLDFIDSLLKPSLLESLVAIRNLREKQKSVLMEFPEAGAFLAAASLPLSAKELNQMWAQLTQTLGIKSRRYQNLIESLVESGWLVKSDEGFRLQAVCLDTRGNEELALQLRKYWLAQASDFLQKADDVLYPHRFAIFTITLSEEADKKAAEAYHKYIFHLKEIVTNDQDPKTRLRCVNVQDLWLNFAGSKKAP